MVKGKVAIITGGASGIGLAMSQSFAKEGAKVVMADVNEAKLKEEAQKIGADCIAVDLSKKEGCKALVDFALQKHGRVDILINIAGIQTVSSVEEFPEDKWEFMINLMLSAPFYCSKYVWKSMKANGWGRIINLNSIHGLVASEFKSAYVSAKHGLSGFTKTAGLEGGPQGITVNSICPAYVRTPLVENQIQALVKNDGVPTEKVITDIMLVKSAIKKLLEPSTIAEIALFLCSDAAAGITGACLPIDGGWTAG